MRLESSGRVEHLDLAVSWTISVAGMASWLRFNHVQTFWYTLPETNTVPENRPLEKEIPIENHHF